MVSELAPTGATSFRAGERQAPVRRHLIIRGGEHKIPLKVISTVPLPDLSFPRRLPYRVLEVNVFEPKGDVLPDGYSVNNWTQGPVGPGLWYAGAEVTTPDGTVHQTVFSSAGGLQVKSKSTE